VSFTALPGAGEVAPERSGLVLQVGMEQEIRLCHFRLDAPAATSVTFLQTGRGI
jgi:hypothetical protein